MRFFCRDLVARSLFCLVCSTGVLQASAMTKMFESLGTNGHYSTPGAYHDQAAGYYTGGGFVMRQRNQTYQPIQVSLPHIGAGCNGIDAYFGGFSFMKGSQLVKMLKSMASQAPTYAMQLGLKVMSPTIENLLAQLRKKLMDINATMMEDCRLVEQTFAALAPKGSAFETHACQDVMSHSGGDSDWFGAREKCQSSHEREQVTQSLKEKNPDLMMGEYNLVWHVLQKMDKLDDAFRTFIQSAIGTVVSRKEGDALRLEFKEGKADDKTFLSAWLRGGETSMLVCNERDKCLAPSWVMHTLNPNEGMRYKIMNKIQVIRRKYITGKVLTEEEMSFLGDTVNLPVYRYIQVSAATGTEFMLMEAADFIAVTLLLSQFDKISSQILSNIESLQKIQMEDSVIESFKGNLQRTRLRLQDLLSTVNSGSVWRLTQMIQAHEKSLLAKEG